MCNVAVIIVLSKMSLVLICIFFHQMLPSLCGDAPQGMVTVTNKNSHDLPCLLSTNCHRSFVLIVSCGVPGIFTSILIWSSKQFFLLLNDILKLFIGCHNIDVIMSAMTSQITSLTVVYSTVYSDADQRKIKSPRHWPLWGEFTGTGEFPAQMASYAENVSI